MKEDITQHRTNIHTSILSCGLVMKEDITQLPLKRKSPINCCGLVMKEDITQQGAEHYRNQMCCGLVMKENVPCCQQTAQKKYPWILGNVSLDKRASIQGYPVEQPFHRDSYFWGEFW